ncbi:MAG: nucleotide exchange factor GrpE [Oscillospiraceae bacterium]|nr:nucleotide exchange factor GrpE [Oscillospiraceae bacterium]
MAENKTEAPVAEEVEAAVEETAAEEAAASEKSENDALAELNEKYLRLAAEYDNYRKRTAKEKEGIYANARIDTVTAFLGVHDNLERGIRQYEEDSPHRQGLEMIMKQFDAALESLGVTEIQAEGAEFDPNIHNAVMHVDDENLGENVVAEVFEKGFMLGDKVLRFATVKVAN